MFSNDGEKNQAILQEIRLMKRLSGHANIIKFITAASKIPERAMPGQIEFLVCMELCPGEFYV